MFQQQPFSTGDWHHQNCPFQRRRLASSFAHPLKGACLRPTELSHPPTRLIIPVSSRSGPQKVNVLLLFSWFGLYLCIWYLLRPEAKSGLRSVQFSHSVVSYALWPHELQHTRPPCPSQTPRVHSNSHPSSRWCHPAISSSVVPFSSCPQSLPASESFPMSQLFHMRWPKYWSFSFSIIPSKQHLGLISFRMDWLDLLAVQGTFKSLFQHHSSKASILRRSAFFIIHVWICVFGLELPWPALMWRKLRLDHGSERAES